MNTHPTQQLREHLALFVECSARGEQLQADGQFIREARALIQRTSPDTDQTALLRVVHRSDRASYAVGAMTAACVLVGVWCALRIVGTI